MLETLGQQSSLPSRAKSIARRWAIIFTGLLMLAGVEGFILWIGGVRYEPDSDFISVSVSDLSFDATGDRAAALVHFKRRSKNVGMWRDVVLLNLRGHDPLRLNVPDFAPECVAMSPCSNSIVFTGRSRKIFSIAVTPALKPNTVRPMTTVFAESVSPRIKRLVFSPNGKYLAAASRDSVFVWDYADGRLLHHFPHSDAAFESIGFSPDSHIVFSSRDALGPCLWDVQSGEIVESFHLFGQRGLRTTWSFNARLLAATTPGKVSVFGSDSRERVWGTPASYSEPGGAFSPQGHLLAYAGRSDCRSGIHICESASGSQVGWLDTPGSSIKGVMFSPDGRLYAWDVGGTITAWDEKCPTHVWSFSVLEWASRANWPVRQSD